MNKHIMKEYLAHLYFSVKAVIPPWESGVEERVISDLNDKGYHVLPDFLDAGRCEQYVREFDRVVEAAREGEVWKDKLGADTRLFFAERYSQVFASALADPILNRIKNAYMGPDFFRHGDCLMINRITAVEQNLGSGGGWHRDSPYSKQLKAIIYLTDVEEENGPFQMIVGTHRLESCLALHAAGLTREGQYRFEESQVSAIEKYLGADSLRTFPAQRGTCLLVNTKGIHRGAPIQLGERVAMAYYFGVADGLEV